MDCGWNITEKGSYMIKYSASTNAFYDVNINKVIPDDAVEISTADHALLLENQSKGMAIISGPNGYPISRPIQPSKWHTFVDGVWVLDESKQPEMFIARFAEATATTERLIVTGSYLFRDIPFSIDSINQSNFMALMVQNMAGMVTFPYEIWQGTQSTALADATELGAFLVGFSTTIETLRREGKATRDALVGLTAQELLD